MLEIYMARHGQDEDNAEGLLNGRRDRALTPKGIEQAHLVAEKIKELGIGFDKIYTSPLQRAANTAKIISETIGGQNPEILDLLIERDFGVMTGKPQNKIVELTSPDIIQTDTVTYFLSPDGAETFPQLITRARKLFDFVNQKHKEGKVLLVTHGDFGKMAYCAYYNLDWKEVLKQFHFGNSELLLMSPNSNSENVHIFHIEQHNL